MWEALLDDMPMTALIRNLATLTRIGLLTPGSATAQRVIDQLGDGERLRRARHRQRGGRAVHARPAQAVRLSRQGLDGDDRKTLEEIGEQFGVTRERIRQIEEIALKKLRKRIQELDTAQFAA